MNIMRRAIRLGVVLLMFGTLFVSSAQAADIEVGPACSLADAITAANTDAAVGGCSAGSGADTIRLTIDTALSADLPAIESDLTIEGGGFTISGGSRHQILSIEAGAVTINEATLIGGLADFGGAIENYGELTITNSSIVGNTAVEAGAILSSNGLLTIHDSDISDNSAEFGGAIVMFGGEFELRRSTLSGNSSTGDGGAIALTYSRLRIYESSLARNSAVNGGAIYGVGTSVGLIDTSFSENSAESDGGALFLLDSDLVYAVGSLAGNSATYGGAMLGVRTDMHMLGTVFEDNSAIERGGAIYFEDSVVEMDGAAFTSNSASYAGAIYTQQSPPSTEDGDAEDSSAEDNDVENGAEGAISLVNTSFSGNRADKSAGAILSYGTALTMEGGVFAENAAAHAGALHGVEAEISLVDAELRNNSAQESGGAIYVRDSTLTLAGGALAENSATYGGAIILFDSEASVTASSFSDNGNSESEYAEGGAIQLEQGSLSISDSQITGSRLTGGSGQGGAICVYDGSLSIRNTTIDAAAIEGEEALGGAIYVRNGDISLVDSAISASSAWHGGGLYAYGSEVDISASEFSENHAGYVGGAVFVSESEVTIDDVTFADNSAGEPVEGDGAEGGAMHNFRSKTVIRDSRFFRNSAQSGGALRTNKYVLVVEDSVFDANTARSRGGALITFGPAQISGSNFTRNVAEESGGAIYTWEGRHVEISDSAFLENDATWGGAIYNDATIDIDGSTFIRNKADWGGAIYNRGQELKLEGSYFYRNRAIAGGGAILGKRDSMSTVTNSSFGNNSARQNGGMLLAMDSSKTALTHVTLSSNVAAAGGGIYQEDEASIAVFNSIISFSRGGDCVGSLARNVGNFIGDGSCNSQLTGNPRLGTRLHPEDGSPPYYPLMADSKVIDAAAPAHCLESDQIGTPRPEGDGCDIGAIEYLP